MVAKANRSTFDRAVAHVLKWEGDNSFDRNGGKIRFGIHQANHPSIDVAKLTRDDAIEVHRSCYWDGIRAEELPVAIAPMVFDCAVSLGVATAIRILQYAVGVVRSGVMDTQTIRATLDSDPLATICYYSTLRIAWCYEQLKSEYASRGLAVRTMECSMICSELGYWGPIVSRLDSRILYLEGRVRELAGTAVAEVASGGPSVEASESQPRIGSAS